jgi:signal transduction histidine kinase
MWRVDWRPLDPVRSIKAKLGLLVVSVVGIEVGLLWYSLVVAGWRSRYVVLAVVLVALVVTQVLAHGMTSPLRQMTAAARAMAAGQPPPPVRTSSRDEVGDLARAFTAMSADLSTADMQRRELLANVAHELRTPIAAMRAQVENLLDGVRPADQVALREVLEQTERLGALVDDLLDLARAEAGATRLDRSPVRVAALVEDVVREVGVARPGPAVQVQVPADLVVDADQARLRQVLVNLLDNASRHARDRVVVTAGAGPGGGLRLEVDDDGPGIPEQDWVAVFERFRRGAVESEPARLTAALGDLRVTGGGALADGSALVGTGARADGGTGLGLAIARWAVELHGGRISVVPSEVGCRIRVELPAHIPEPVEPVGPVEQ